MFDFTKIFGRHELDVWRDEQTLAAATKLNQVAADLANDFEDKLHAAGLWNILVRPGSFIATDIAPTVRETTERAVSSIIDHANRDLQNIISYRAVWNDIPREVGSRDDAAPAILDIAFAAGPLAGGLATAAAIPAMAVTTTSAFFGLVTTTVISWPVVALGGTLAATGIATGVFNTARVRAKAEARSRKAIHNFVVASLLIGRPGEPSILEQLTTLFARTASEAKKL